MYDKQAPETISALFDSIANSYDSANQIMSFGMHKIWNRALTEELKKKSRADVFLDLCAGTGEIAFTYLKKMDPAPTVHLLDFSSSMLEVAKKKACAKNLSLNFIHGSAEDISLPSNSIDHVSLAYGIRNIKNPKKCMEEVFRVLNINGHFGILELTRPNQAILRRLHAFYLASFLPLVGKCVASNQSAYNYLSSSIKSFLEPTDLKEMLQNTGFKQITIKPLLGGIATLIVSSKLKD